MNDFFKLDTVDMLKHINKIDPSVIETRINTKGLTISKELHSAISCLYPELLDNLINENDLSSLYGCNELIAYIQANRPELYKKLQSEHSSIIEDYEVSRIINNRFLTEDSVKDFIDDCGVSKRRRVQYARIYPSLHTSFIDPADNYKHSTALMALEYGDENYILKNIDYYKTHLLEKFKDQYSKACLHLNRGQYFDSDLLKHLNERSLAKLAVTDDVVKQFWIHHDETCDVTVDNYELFKFAIENNLEITSITYDLIRDHASELLKHYPYFYASVVEEGIDVSLEEKIEVLKHDPYSIVHMINVDTKTLDYKLFEAFIISSNSNLYESKMAIDVLNQELSEGYLNFLLVEFMYLFDSKYSGLCTFPLLAFFVDDGDYMTPYMINHIIKMDNRMFEYM